MKSVKSKLFTGFALVIFIILLILSFISIQLFSFNQESESMNLVDETNKNATAFIKQNNDDKIKELDRYMDLRSQFLIVIKDGKIMFSTEANFKTNRILREINEEFDDDRYEDNKYEEDEYDKEHRGHKRRGDEKEYWEFYDGFSGAEYLKVDEFVISYDLIEKEHSNYILYVGIDEDLVDGHMSNVVFGILALNTTIFIILLGLGYILINRTIRPLRQILDEVNELQSVNDLSKRLKEVNTKDEFEQLSHSFNKMLNNIENSVENIKQFSSDASHELKTPLTVIQGEIELCKSSPKTKEELTQSLDKINIEQKKLQDIIKNFLLLSRLDKEVLKNSTSNLDKVVFEAIELNLEKIEEKNLELKLDIEEELKVNFDEKYLNIVINNLLTNATKYTNEGFISLSAKNEGSKIIFEIKDSGIGISNEDKNKIFERFYRVDKARTTTKDGIGLGLSIVKKICDRFGTSIQVKSEVDIGSSFKLIFTA